MTQDGKALQSGTSHFRGRSLFAKSFRCYLLEQGEQAEYVWATSWGVSTRLMGALITVHSDDNGLSYCLQSWLLSRWLLFLSTRATSSSLRLLLSLQPVIDQLRELGITVKYDDNPAKRPGFKFADYELKGVPVRLAMGGRDLENNTIEIMRCDTLEKENVELRTVSLSA